MKKEINLRKDELQHKSLKSLYFGGGTPSILEISELGSLVDEIQKYFEFDKEIEITLEANPDDLSQNFLKGLHTIGFNRLSIGVQSFFDEDLKLMNRVHHAQQAESAIKSSQDCGFENISIDLIYGAPSSDFTVWKKNLEKTIELQVPHVSSYALTVEPKTALENWISRKIIPAPETEEQNRAFFFMSEFLSDHGFEHYEISNFAKSGYQSKHNSSYWKYKEYLGIGPSAHSYNGQNTRSWNVANNALYLKDLNQNKLPLQTEILSEKDQFNEMLMIGLRTVWGVDLNAVKSRFSEELLDFLNKNIQPKLESGILETDGNFLKIPRKYWFLADGIASDLFLV